MQCVGPEGGIWNWSYGMGRRFLDMGKETIPDIKGTADGKSGLAPGPSRPHHTCHDPAQSSSPGECIIARHPEKAQEEGQREGQLGGILPSTRARSGAPWV